MGSYKCIFLKTKGSTRVAPNGPPIQTKMFMMCKFLRFYLLSLLNYCYFWGRRSGLITFGHSNNFVRHKKLNLYGVLKIYFIQNQRRYKICSKMATKCHKFSKSRTNYVQKMWFGHLWTDSLDFLAPSSWDVFRFFSPFDVDPFFVALRALLLP